MGYRGRGGRALAAGALPHHFGALRWEPLFFFFFFELAVVGHVEWILKKIRLFKDTLFFVKFAGGHYV